MSPYPADASLVTKGAEWPSADKELTLAFKRGEDGAYQAIYQRYHARVHSVCRRILSNHDDAAEASQETFLRVYQALGRFNGRYQLGPWITRIATNVCLDHLRARSRKPSAPVPSELIELELDQEAEQYGPEAIVIRNSESRHVRRILEHLPPMHRAAIVLRDFEGLSYEEVAIALEISDAQAKALIHRARQNFKRSWTSSIVAAFVPLRNLMHRIKEFGATATDQVTGAATASSCVSATAAERICAAAAAVLIGGTVGPSVFGHGSPAYSSESRSSQETAASPLLAMLKPEPTEVQGRRIDRSRHADRKSKKTNEPVAEQPVGEPAAELPVAEPSPTPSADPTPSPEPTQVGGGDSGSHPEPTPEPTLAPADPSGFTLGFYSSLAADYACSCTAPTKVESESLWIADSGLSSFSQRLTGTAYAAGSPAFGLSVNQSGDATTHRMDFGLRTAEGVYMYRGTGELVERTRTSWGGWSYRYAGTYERASQPSSHETMPQRGTYSVEIVFSWRETRIVGDTFALNEY